MGWRVRSGGRVRGEMVRCGEGGVEWRVRGGIKKGVGDRNL